jgi:hypothetical protein
MGLYVEFGYARDAVIEVAAARREVLRGLQSEGILKGRRLVAERSVVMNPACVHITGRSNEAVAAARERLARHGVCRLGRYGGWTNGSIEDNILEARSLAASLGCTPSSGSYPLSDCWTAERRISMLTDWTSRPAISRV